MDTQPQNYVLSPTALVTENCSEPTMSWTNHVPLYCGLLDAKRKA